MKILVFLTVFVVAASASTFHFRQKDELLDVEWASFKAAFNKKYPTPQHEAVRRLLWEQNMRNIQKHNFEADLGKHSYRLGINQYGDLSNAEYRQQVLCLGMEKTRNGSTFLPPSNLKLPSSVDWRTKGYVTPVQDQGNCGSCWAFSATGAVEGQHYKKAGLLVKLSEQNLVDCSGQYGNNGCQGGLMDNAFSYITANHGIDTEVTYPYEARNGPCRFKSSNVGATVTNHVDLPSGNEILLQTAVASVGPVSVAIDASHSSFHNYKSGVYYEPYCGSSMMQLNHGVLVVGYGTLYGQDYWLVKNSWNTTWGMSGYIMMARNRNNNCGIATLASYPLV